MTTIPPPTPSHSIADVLRLVDEIRSIAFDRGLADVDIARRIRDSFRVYDAGDES